MATVAFLRFGGVDALLGRAGPEGVAAALDALVRDVQEAADEQGVCLLDSDVDADGGKLRLTAGAPLAMGDDEERMLIALRRIADGKRDLALRIGVTRGPVFTGAIGPPWRRTYALMGDTVNLAARVMGKSRPGTVLATAAVVERVRARFAFEAVEPFAVKGKLRPVEAAEVGEPRRASEEAAPDELPLVGRARELAAIADALAGARAGTGSVVELSGAPGLGKTRLLREAIARAEGLHVLTATCEAYSSATPYAAWRDVLRRHLGAALDEPHDAVLARLRTIAAERDPAVAPWLPLIAAAAGLRMDDTPETARLAPEFRAARLHESVLGFMARTAPGPLLIAIDQAHAMDAASAALLGALAQRSGALPWAVLLARRTDEGGTQPGAAVKLELGPLSQAETSALARHAAETHALPPHLIELAAARCDGSPQFLADLLSAAETGSTHLPDSIEAAVTAQIDRLGPADRALVRRAALLGAGFRAADLRDVLAPGTPLPDADDLARLDAVLEQREDGVLRFRRAAVREAAYAGLPFRLRRELHGAVARRLQSEPDSDPAVLSLHLALAGEAAAARGHALAAARDAREQAAFADAAELLRRAIAAGREAQVEPALLAEDYAALGDTLRRLGEPEAATAALRSARRLAGGDPVREAELLLAQARVAERSSSAASTARWAGRALRLLEGLEGAEAGACRARLISIVAGLRQRQGRAREAERLCRQAIAEAEAAGEERALAHACYVLDWALVASGRSSEAVHSPRALAIYERLGDLEHQAKVLNNSGMFAYYEGRWDEAVDLYRRGARCAEQAGDLANAAYGDCNVGEVLSDQGQLEEAAPRLRRALAVWRGAGDEQGAAFAAALLGRLEVRMGRNDEGTARIAGALAEFERLGFGADAALAEAFLAEAAVFRHDAVAALEIAGRLMAAGQASPLVLRVRGVALAQLGDPEAAEQVLGEALDAAREDGSAYEVAATLDALEALAGAWDTGIDGTRVPERDELLTRLEATRLPELPVAPRWAAPPGS